MEREIKLTLDNDLTEELQVPMATVPEELRKKEDITLTEEEQRQVEEFAKQIDLTATKAVIEYGSGAQNQISQFSERTLQTVRTKDLGEVGELLTGVVKELRSFEHEEEEKGFFGFFKKQVNNAQALKARYDSAEANIGKISETLEQHQRRLLKDVALLDQMYDLNASYYKELSMYIMAGQKRLEKAKSEELPALQSSAEVSGSPIALQEARDLAESMGRFEKKLHDLELTRMVSLQMAPQIRMIQAGDRVMAEKIHSTIVNTIPLWKSQMVMALSAENTSKAGRAQEEVADMTNALLRKNAEALHQSTVATAKSAERSIVDTDTIRHTNEQLIKALEEVREIQNQGRQQRQEASEEIQKLEGELKEALRAIVTEQRGN